jgi:2,3-bisphosphoglycerate-dependent phosphoglycerate mutase
MFGRAVTILLLIRHAHVSDDVSDARLRGWYDAPLSDAGLRQLTRMLEAPFNLVSPDALYTSTSTRACVTVNAFAAAWGLTVVPDARLREIHCGRLDGALVRDIECV